MDKIKVNVRQYEVLENHKNNVEMLINKVINKSVCDMESFNEKDILRCYLFGYEVEETPEEKLLSVYKYYEENGDYGTEERVICEVLEALGIKIKGIND